MGDVNVGVGSDLDVGQPGHDPFELGSDVEFVDDVGTDSVELAVEAVPCPFGDVEEGAVYAVEFAFEPGCAFPGGFLE